MRRQCGRHDKALCVCCVCMRVWLCLAVWRDYRTTMHPTLCLVWSHSHRTLGRRSRTRMRAVAPYQHAHALPHPTTPNQPPHLDVLQQLWQVPQEQRVLHHALLAAGRGAGGGSEACAARHGVWQDRRHKSIGAGAPVVQGMAMPWRCDCV